MSLFATVNCNAVRLSQYLDLLDWTGRQLRHNKNGRIPNHLTCILTRLGINPDGWLTVVRKFGRLFKRAAGTSESLETEAARRNQNYMHAPGVKTLQLQA